MHDSIELLYITSLRHKFGKEEGKGDAGVVVREREVSS